MKEALCKYFVSAASYLGAVSVFPTRMTCRPKCGAPAGFVGRAASESHEKPGALWADPRVRLPGVTWYPGLHEPDTGRRSCEDHLLAWLLLAHAANLNARLFIYFRLSLSNF